MQKDSYFDGSVIGYLVNSIIVWLIITVTLGIGTPWALCIQYKWEIEHTIVEGRRLGFDGTAMQLFGNWIKWFLLIIITLGIYTFWVNVKLLDWKARHTYFMD